MTGLTSPTLGAVSVYRRPLPAANLGFLSTIMWDGREPTSEDQAVDATTGHAQGITGPNIVQQAQIIAFETDLFTAQNYDNKARALYFPFVKGGPGALSAELTKFFIGINDPLGNNPRGTPFDPNIFDLYNYWLTLRGRDSTSQQRESIARGEKLFNTTKITITGVSGLNDELGKPAIQGFCGTCHDTPNVGNHSVKAPLDIGVADAGIKSPPDLDISGLPVFTLTCKLPPPNPLAGKVYVVTDPGRALISGQCKDIGRLKGPILRGLASRAPYFHNGSAATLKDVVNFYNDRFKLGFTNTDKDDLVNFLNAL
jgi:cytochrome c peroxidase